MMEFSVKEVQYLESPLFWTKRFAKYGFLGICKVFNITNNANLPIVHMKLFYVRMLAAKINLLFASFTLQLTLPC